LEESFPSFPDSVNHLTDFFPLLGLSVPLDEGKELLKVGGGVMEERGLLGVRA